MQGAISLYVEAGLCTPVSHTHTAVVLAAGRSAWQPHAVVAAPRCPQGCESERWVPEALLHRTRDSSARAAAQSCGFAVVHRDQRLAAAAQARARLEAGCTSSCAQQQCHQGCCPLQPRPAAPVLLLPSGSTWTPRLVALPAVAVVVVVVV